jgi:GH15 family glucan-1,4-alpha-glucosidase/ferredoxin
MPRDIPVGNGRLLLTFDHQYQIRDIYFPHVGQENHAGNGPCRFGVYTDVPGRGRSRLAWTSEDGWTIRQRYLRDTLTSSVSLDHRELRLAMYCNDVVDFHRPIHIRKIKLKNMEPHERVVRLMHHQDINMFGTKIGDTAYYDPELKSVVHYRAKRYLMVTFFGAEPGDPLVGATPAARDGAAAGHAVEDSTLRVAATQAPPLQNAQRCVQRIDEFACGTSGFQGAEGTWRDAEDGHLQGNAIAQGAVDSTISHHVRLAPEGERTVYMAIIAGHSREELLELHKWLNKMGPQGVIDRTTAYWRLWVGGTNINFGNLPNKVVELFKRSLLVVRTQIDNNGAICAANDSDIMQFSRDTYSYVWPRDGALVSDALDLAGFPDVARSFYTFCQKAITDEGFFYHKYNPDGSPASSWHPWVIKGQRAMPIQEDETALVVWALWRHYYRYRDIEFIRPMWVDVVQKAADFMCRYRDARTGLPLPSYDLWEERWGVHAFTVATVFGGLKAAANFAVCFGDRERAERYKKAAEEIRAGAEKYLYSGKLGRFVRRLVPKDDPNGPDRNAPDSEKYTGTFGAPAMHESRGAGGSETPAAPLARELRAEEIYEVDEVIDASLFAIYKFHLFEADDPRVVATLKQMEEKLWVKTRVGGMARYENDYYHRVSNDIAAVPGNPWFICTLWLADYFITRAQSTAELKMALPIFEWTAAHALESGVLAEQVNPYTNAPISVSPLTWSHATVVSTAIKYLEKLEQLQLCTSCNQPVYRMRRAGPVEVKSQATFDRLEADFEVSDAREMASGRGEFQKMDPRSRLPLKVTLSIDQRDCIGCDVCVAHCDKGVLRMIDGKAYVDLRYLNKCDLDGECVEVCPTDVVSLFVEPAEQNASAPAIAIVPLPIKPAGEAAKR